MTTSVQTQKRKKNIGFRTQKICSGVGRVCTKKVPRMSSLSNGCSLKYQKTTSKLRTGVTTDAVRRGPGKENQKGKCGENAKRGREGALACQDDTVGRVSRDLPRVDRLIGREGEPRQWPEGDMEGKKTPPKSVPG